LSSTFNPSQLQELVTRARQATSFGQFELARQSWQAMLNILPSDAPERPHVQREIDRLNQRLQPQPVKANWKKRLGPLGVVIAFLAKFKTAFLVLAKFKYLLSMLAFIAVYWAMFGPLFAVGFFASIFIHEFGHYVVVRRYGMQAKLPMFIPLIGAYVQWTGTNVDPGVRANISLAGPLFGLLSGLLSFGLYTATGNQVWLAVAQIAGWLNLLNLIPIGIFDGGKAMDAISAGQRTAILALSVAMLFIAGEGNLLPWAGLAAGTAYRLYKRDTVAPREMVGYYFIALAVANGFLSWYCINIANIHPAY
jgi:Zn-dependent protease